eukprot:1006915-Rhodomonas_salina.2
MSEHLPGRTPHLPGPTVVGIANRHNEDAGGESCDALSPPWSEPTDAESSTSRSMCVGRSDSAPSLAAARHLPSLKTTWCLRPPTVICAARRSALRVQRTFRLSESESPEREQVCRKESGMHRETMRARMRVGSVGIVGSCGIGVRETGVCKVSPRSRFLGRS